MLYLFKESFFKGVILKELEELEGVRRELRSFFKGVRGVRGS